MGWGAQHEINGISLRGLDAAGGNITTLYNFSFLFMWSGKVPNFWVGTRSTFLEDLTNRLSQTKSALKKKGVTFLNFLDKETTSHGRFLHQTTMRVEWYQEPFFWCLWWGIGILVKMGDRWVWGEGWGVRVRAEGILRREIWFVGCVFFVQELPLNIHCSWAFASVELLQKVFC